MTAFPHPSLATLSNFFAFIKNLKTSIQSFGVLPWGRRWAAGFTPRKSTFQTQAHLFGFCGRQISTGAGSSPTLSVFLCRNHSIETAHPYLIHFLLVQYIQGGQKVFVHLMITVQKTRENILSRFKHLS
jgi:hypothetical protein